MDLNSTKLIALEAHIANLDRNLAIAQAELQAALDLIAGLTTTHPWRADAFRYVTALKRTFHHPFQQEHYVNCLRSLERSTTRPKTTADDNAAS